MYRYLRALAYFPNTAHAATYERLMASLSHILEQTVPAGKSNQNPAYARASVLTEAAAVCLQIEATPLLKVCLDKVRAAAVGRPPDKNAPRCCHSCSRAGRLCAELSRHLI